MAQKPELADIMKMIQNMMSEMAKDKAEREEKELQWEKAREEKEEREKAREEKEKDFI